MEGSGLGASRLDHSYVSSYWIIHIWIYLRGFLKMVLLSNHAYNKTSSVLSIPETHGFGDSHFEKPTKSEFGLRPCTHHSCYPPLLLTKHIQVISICPSCRHIYIYLFGFICIVLQFCEGYRLPYHNAWNLADYFPAALSGLDTGFGALILGLSGTQMCKRGLGHLPHNFLRYSS